MATLNRRLPEAVQFDQFVLAAATSDLRGLPVAHRHADAIEFRMDLATDPVGQLEEYTGTLPIIATNRIQSEGGDVTEGPDRRKALRTAARLDAVEAIDLELAALEEGRLDDVRSVADRSGAAVIVSAHDFDATPEPDRMSELLQRAASIGAVGKLAVWADDRRDVLDLLRVTLDRSSTGDIVATMAMGPVGQHSRVVAPLYGSRIGYAPVDPADATAPGQYELETLRELIEALQIPAALDA